MVSKLLQKPIDKNCYLDDVSAVHVGRHDAMRLEDPVYLSFPGVHNDIHGVVQLVHDRFGQVGFVKVNHKN